MTARDMWRGGEGRAAKGSLDRRGRGIGVWLSFSVAVATLLAVALATPRRAEAVGEVDGTRPCVGAVPAYVNPWIRPTVNLFTGELAIFHRIQGGMVWSGPSPVLDPAHDLPVGSSPAAGSLTGPEAAIQARSRIPLQRSLGVELCYTSGTSAPGGVAQGWRHTYQVDLSFTAEGNAVVTWGDHRQDTLLRTITGSPAETTWVGPVSLEARVLRKIGADLYRLDAQHGGYYRFSSGHLLDIIDRVGTRTLLSYQGPWRVATVAITGRHTALYFTYDGSGNLTQIKGDAVPATLFAYDTSANPPRLITVTDRLWQTVHYEYGTTTGRIEKITEQDGDAMSVVYYPQYAQAVHYARMGDATRMFSYDQATRTTHVYDSQLINGAQQWGKVAYQFNTSGECTAVNDNGATFGSTYDPATRKRTQYVDPHSYTTSATYDSLGNLLSVTDPMGNTDHVTYESTFHLASQIQDASGVTLTITRDAYGSPTQVTDPLGNATRFEWTPWGNPLEGSTRLLSRVIGPRVDSTSYTYRASDWLMSSVRDPGGYTTSYSYVGGDGRPTSLTDALGNVTTMTYLDRGELDAVVRPGIIASMRFGWGPTGNLELVTAPSGVYTHYYYDAPNRLIRTIDPLGNSSQVKRDPAGQVIEQLDPLGHSWRFTLDATGHSTAVTDADGSMWSYTWDCCHLVTATDPGGNTVSNAYDSRGLLTSRSSTGVSATFAYDAAGRLLTASSSDGDTVVTHTYTYDGAGRRIRHQQTGIDLDTHYDLDSGGLPYRIWDTGRPDSIRYVYDRRGLPTTILVIPPGLASWEAYLRWDGRGQRTGTSFNTGASYRDSSTYDPSGRMTAIDNFGNGWSASYDFNYNVDDWISQVSGSHPGLGSFTLGLSRDSDNRLTGEDLAYVRTFGYSYDAADRRVLKTATPGGTDAYTYAADNRLLSAGAASLSYDAASRCTLMVVPPDTLRFSYRSDGAIRTISRRGPVAGGAITGTWRATIGPFGELAAWLMPDGKRFWIAAGDNFGWRPLRISTSSPRTGHLVAKQRDDYIYAPGATAPLLWQSRLGAGPAQGRTLYRGPFGSVGEVDSGGVGLKWQRLYGPFGESRDMALSGTSSPLQTFAGLSIVPRDNGSGSILPGIPDSTLLVDCESGVLYSPRLGIHPYKGDPGTQAGSAPRWPARHGSLEYMDPTTGPVGIDVTSSSAASEPEYALIPSHGLVTATGQESASSGPEYSYKYVEYFTGTTITCRWVTVTVPGTCCPSLVYRKWVCSSRPTKSGAASCSGCHR